MKLKQKQFLKGSKEFEIVDGTLFVRMKSFLKEEKLTIDLSTLSPDPVIKDSELAFFNPYKGHPVLTLLVNKPDTARFTAFVDALKQSISGDDTPSANPDTTAPETEVTDALARNVYEEPDWLKEPDSTREKTSFKPVIAGRLETDISMLKTYLDENDIKPLLNAMEQLRAEPHNEAAFLKLRDTFDNMGIQGAVLTYATYLKVLMAEASRT